MRGKRDDAPPPVSCLSVSSTSAPAAARPRSALAMSPSRSSPSQRSSLLRPRPASAMCTAMPRVGERAAASGRPLKRHAAAVAGAAAAAAERSERNERARGIGISARELEDRLCAEVVPVSTLHNVPRSFCHPATDFSTSIESADIIASRMRPTSSGASRNARGSADSAGQARGMEPVHAPPVSLPLPLSPMQRRVASAHCRDGGRRRGAGRAGSREEMDGIGGSGAGGGGGGRVPVALVLMQNRMDLLKAFAHPRRVFEETGGDYVEGSSITRPSPEAATVDRRDAARFLGALHACVDITPGATPAVTPRSAESRCGAETPQAQDAAVKAEIPTEVTAEAASRCAALPATSAFMTMIRGPVLDGGGATAAIRAKELQNRLAAFEVDVEESVLAHVPPSLLRTNLARRWTNSTHAITRGQPHCGTNASTSGQRCSTATSSVPGHTGRAGDSREGLHAVRSERIKIGYSLRDDDNNEDGDEDGEDGSSSVARPEGPMRTTARGAALRFLELGRHAQVGGDSAASAPWDIAGRHGVDAENGDRACAAVGDDRRRSGSVFRKRLESETASAQSPSFLAEITVNPLVPPLGRGAVRLADAAAEQSPPSIDSMLTPLHTELRKHLALPPNSGTSFELVISKEAFVLVMYCENDLCGLKIVHALLSKVAIGAIPCIASVRLIRSLVRDRMLNESPRRYHESELAEFAEAKAKQLGLAASRERRRGKKDADTNNYTLEALMCDASSLDSSATSDDGFASTTSASSGVAQRALLGATARDRQSARSGFHKTAGKKSCRTRPSPLAPDDLAEAAARERDLADSDAHEPEPVTDDEAAVLARVSGSFRRERSPSTDFAASPHAVGDGPSARFPSKGKLKSMIQKKILVGLAFASAQERQNRQEMPFTAWRESRRAVTRSAIVIANATFPDPDIAPCSMIRVDAERVSAALRRFGYDVDMLHEAADSEFLRPTLRNINRIVRTIMNNVASEESSVVLVFLTRGVVGTLAGTTAAHTPLRPTKLAFTQESKLAALEARHVITPEGLAQFEDRFGHRPLVLIDTWPVPAAPCAVSAGTADRGHGAGVAWASVTSRTGAASDCSIVYPRNSGGLLSYYLLRALDGFAVKGRLDPGSSVITAAMLIQYLQPRLERRRCTVVSNCSAASAVSSFAYFRFADYMVDLEVDATRRASREAGLTHAPQPAMGPGFCERLKAWERQQVVRCNVKLEVRLGDEVVPVRYSGQAQLFKRQLTRAFVKVFGTHEAAHPPSGSSVHPATPSSRKQGSRLHGSDPSGAQSVSKEGVAPHLCFWRESQRGVALEFRDAAEILADSAKTRALEQELERLLLQLSQHVRKDDSATTSPSSAPLQMPLSSQPHSLKLPHKPSLHCSYTPALGASRVEISLSQPSEELVGWLEETLLARGRTTRRVIRRPRNVFLEVDASFICTRRQARKFDRALRQQSIFALAPLLWVYVDPHPPPLHALVARTQAALRGAMQFRRFQQQQRMRRLETEQRDALASLRASELNSLFVEAQVAGRSTVHDTALAIRSEVRVHEAAAFGSILQAATHALLVQEKHQRFVIRTEEITTVHPLVESAVRGELRAQEWAAFVTLRRRQALQCSEQWQRFYVELDWYRTVLTTRNAFRKDAYFRVVIRRPRPPSTVFDIASVIVDDLFEEKCP